MARLSRCTSASDTASSAARTSAKGKAGGRSAGTRVRTAESWSAKGGTVRGRTERARMLGLEKDEETKEEKRTYRGCLALLLLG